MMTPPVNLADPDAVYRWLLPHMKTVTLSPQERARRLHHLATGEIGAGVDYVVTTPGMLAAAMNQRRRRQRKPSIRKTIAAAERGGKTVTSITTPDGVTLHFGKGEPTEASNPWPLDDFKVTKQRLPKYVQAWVDRDGRARCYFRRRGYRLVQLRGLPWSPSFMAEYEKAMSGPRAGIGAGRSKPGSVAAVVAEYLDSQKFFASKSAGTQQMRRGILERFRAAYGERPFALLPPEWIEALLDAKPPHAARSWLVTLRSLCQFAVKRGWLRADPTRDIKQRSIKGDGFHTWTDDEIAQFEAHHPIGTKPRLAFALLLHTTQRRSDVVRMGRQHIRETDDGPALYVKQQKTGVELLLPIYPELQAVLDATPASHLTFLVTATGKPYGGNAFSEQFRNWCDAAGLPKRCKPHGLRKASCRRMAEAEYTANEIMAHSGHGTMKELVRYTKAADQARLARNAFARAVIR